MTVSSLQDHLTNLKRALDRLREGLSEDEDNPLLVDGTIQRFEFLFELSWKAIKQALLEEGIETSTPREAIQKAYQAGWFQNEELWLQMLRDRNRSSHTYDEESAQTIFKRISSDYAKEFECLYSVLIKRESIVTTSPDQ